jgi:uncharacterized damage-inducible protein DinB
MTSDSDRVRSYLISQTERYDWFQLWPRVVRARLDLLEALEGVTEEQARWRPEPDAWSIHECAAHLLRSSENARALIEGLVRGEAKRINADPPLESDDASLAELRDALFEDSARFAAIVTSLPAEVDLVTTADHNRFGPLTGSQWFLFQRIHDTDHANQIRAVREAEGFPAAEEAQA